MVRGDVDMRIAAAAVLAMLASACLQGCETVKPYEKEYLLSPAMDDATLWRLDASIMTSAAQAYEKLGKGGPGAGGGSSCPTCGG